MGGKKKHVERVTRARAARHARHVKLRIAEVEIGGEPFVEPELTALGARLRVAEEAGQIRIENDARNAVIEVEEIALLERTDEPAFGDVAGWARRAGRRRRRA